MRDKSTNTRTSGEKSPKHEMAAKNMSESPKKYGTKKNESAAPAT